MPGHIIKHKHIILALIVIGFVLYAKSFGGAFLWDDEEQIVNNVLVHDIGNITKYFSGSTFNTGGADVLRGVYYRPMMLLAFSILYTVFGENPWAFHIFQVLLHIATSVFLFLFLSAIFRRENDSCFVPNSNKSMKGDDRWLVAEKNTRLIERFTFGKFQIEPAVFAAAVLAIVFLVHPLNVESVAYISAMQDIMYTLFGILALYVAAKNAESRSASFLLSGILLLLSMFSKETSLVFVILFALYGLLFEWKRKALYFGTSVGVMAIYFFVRIFLINVSFGEYEISPISSLSFWERVLTTPKVLWYYISSFFYPNNLSVMQHWVVKTANIADFWVPLTGCLVTFLFGAYFVYVARSKALILFFVWMALALGMHSQIYPLDMTVATRWIYSGLMGMLGVVGMAFGYAFCRYWNKRFARIAIFLLIAFVVFISSKTFLRQDAWQSGYDLYSTDIVSNEGSFDLNNNLGVELFRNGRVEESLQYFEKSIVLQPNWAFPWNNAGAVYENRGDLEKAKKYYKKAIEIGQYYLAYENYAGVLIRQGKIADANVFLKDALRYLPSNKRLQMYYEYSSSKINEEISE